MLGTQATCAKIDVPGLPLDIDSGGVDVGNPSPIGMALGVADVMTEERRFTA
jgi:hypothetical protein